MTVQTYKHKFREWFTEHNFNTNQHPPAGPVTLDRTVEYTDTVSKADPVGHRDWRRAIANGQLLTSALTATNTYRRFGSHWFGERIQRSTIDGSIRTWRAYGVPMYDFAGPPSGTVDPSVVIRAQNQASARFYQNLQAQTTAFQGLVFAGELRETLHMIRHPAQGIRRALSKYLSDVKKLGRSRMGRQRLLEGVRSQWLETQYGILPLVSDVQNAVNAFYGSGGVEPLFKMVRGSGSAEGYNTSQSFTIGEPHNCRLIYRVYTVSHAFVKFYTIQHCDGDGVSQPQLYGFRFNEFIPTLWELIPWSFVADYFTNIGQIISSWSYRGIYAPSAVMTTVLSLENRYVTESWRIFASDSFTEEVSSTFVPGQLSYGVRTINRVSPVAVPVPSFEVRVPGTGTKWINLGALASQLADARRALR